MSAGENEIRQGVGTVDPYTFGIIVGKLQGIEEGIGELKKSIREQPTRRELEQLEERVKTLETAPEKVTSRRLAVGALIVAAISGVGSIVAAFR